MISSLSICLLPLCWGSASTPYERLAPQTSVWSQSIDVRRIDTTRLAESRENLGVFPVGNGNCFAYNATQWVRHESPSSYVNLDAVLRPNDHVAAFARCVLVAERPRRLTFHLGADDGVVLWVGGRRVVERLGHHHHQFGRDQVTVELPQGETPVVVGVHEINGAWGFSLRISDEEGLPPEGITVKPSA